MTVESTVYGVRDVDPRTALERLNGWPEQVLGQMRPPAPVDEKPMSYLLLEKAQVGGVIRRVGEIVQALPSQAGPHMQLQPNQDEDEDMNDAQYQDFKAAMVALLEPVRSLAQMQLNQMQNPQDALTTRAMIGNDAARSDPANAEAMQDGDQQAKNLTEAGAPVNLDQGTMPPAPGPMGPAPAPESAPQPEAEAAPLADMGPQSNAPGETLKETDPVATRDGRVTEVGEESHEPGEFHEL